MHDVEATAEQFKAPALHSLFYSCVIPFVNAKLWWFICLNNFSSNILTLKSLYVLAEVGCKEQAVALNVSRHMVQTQSRRIGC